MSGLPLLKGSKVGPRQELGTMANIDFLGAPTDEHRRKEIKNIKDSYSHPWDILSELLQNSVDAIRRKEADEPGGKYHVEIQVNSQARTIQVEDDGTGFPSDQLGELLAPHGTDKEDAEDEIGQKGIGLKFAIFSCDEFTLESVGPGGFVSGVVKGASSWVERRVGARPIFVDRTHTAHPIEKGTYTVVRLAALDPPSGGAQSVFELTQRQLIVLLRTRTAVGNTRALFGLKSPDIGVTLKFVTPSGKKSEVPVPYSYLSPTEVLKDGDKVRLSDYRGRAGVLSDKQKVAELKDKTIFDTGFEERAGRKIRWYACFVPHRKNWGSIRVGAGLPEEQMEEDKGIAGSLIRDGIFLSTRGMPTGVRLAQPEVGNIVLWPRVFMLVEDDALEFDLGRKSVPGRTQGMLRDIVGGTFNDFVQPALLAGGTSEVLPPPPVFSQARAEAFEDFERLPDLGLRIVRFLKHPDGQEAGVVAIFHELVGSGVLSGYCGLRSSYKASYDFWGRYCVDPKVLGAKVRSQWKKPAVDIPIVIEFKFEAAEIIPDVVEQTKFFEDIDLIVCWDIDVRRFARESIQVRPLPADQVFYQGSNYELEWPQAYNLGPRGTKPVLSLRKLVEELRARPGN